LQAVHPFLNEYPSPPFTFLAIPIISCALLLWFAHLNLVLSLRATVHLRLRLYKHGKACESFHRFPFSKAQSSCDILIHDICTFLTSSGDALASTKLPNAHLNIFAKFHHT
jgi:hypothetical protein